MMLRWQVGIVLLTIGASVTPALAVDLDAPAERKFTVRTELQRGAGAAFDCHLHAPPDSDAYPRLLSTLFCNTKRVDSEKQGNTVTDAFLLGLYRRAYSYDPTQKLYRDGAAKLEAEMHLTDDAVCSAIFEGAKDVKAACADPPLTAN